MSEYSFPCWNQSCGDIIDRDWSDVEEDVSGRMAYCSDACFIEAKKRESDTFNGLYKLNNPYVVGDAAAEAHLFELIKQRNPYVAHSIEEEEVETYSGNWHYLWIPDLQELKLFGEEIIEVGQSIGEAMASIDYSEWEEFIICTHPVKGIALIKAWEALRRKSVYTQ